MKAYANTEHATHSLNILNIGGCSMRARCSNNSNLPISNGNNDNDRQNNGM